MRGAVLPVYDIVRGTGRFKCGRVLEKTQWLPRGEVERVQFKNLRALLIHAYETVPYYRRVFRERGLLPSDIRSLNDLVKLPVLTKKDVRENFNEMISRGFPKSRLIPYTSGGSGDQVKFYITKDQVSWEVAAEFRGYGWAGYRYGDRCFLFWGSPIDLSKSQGIVKRFTRALERITIADTYVMSDKVSESSAHLLLKHKPEIVRGYASSVYMMAKYLLEKGINCVRPRAVITAAETLFDFRRKTIEEAFGCPVFDYYGSREIGAIAAECEEHFGYHISAENVVTEFVEDDEHVAAGERGVVLLTGLRNLGMPLIRYRIGDVGRPSEDVCNCGRGLPLMSSIEGRLSDFLAVYDKNLGRVVPVGPLYPVIASVLIHMPFESCRVTQESLDKIVVRAVKGKGYSDEYEDRLVDLIRSFIGDSVAIEVKLVDSIPPLASGKRSLFTSKIDAFYQPSTGLRNV
jgi:phenylacetate-CoA ligase